MRGASVGRERAKRESTSSPRPCRDASLPVNADAGLRDGVPGLAGGYSHSAVGRSGRRPENLHRCDGEAPHEPAPTAAMRRPERSFPSVVHDADRGESRGRARTCPLLQVSHLPGKRVWKALPSITILSFDQ